MPSFVFLQCLRFALYLCAIYISIFLASDYFVEDRLPQHDPASFFPCSLEVTLFTSSSSNCIQIQMDVSRVTYLIVFPVLNRIHWGIGRFCFCALASFCFVRKDLLDCSQWYGQPELHSFSDPYVLPERQRKAGKRSYRHRDNPFSESVSRAIAVWRG